ncbi:VOC family protein [Actinomadura rupiterrae]|uniref:VOC family protein n=1 Tax=Actinomadura rupiterrae TaxID=559627 RepID=UPI0020A5EAAE|nr:VOC family protein [Actinomadura rupiterrae]MCP2343015.1 putative enzyme related to lactoylglutathione lyase [Actinomadura rupiterrae]
MDWKLELIIMPVSDIDRAKAFYAERCGWAVDVDFEAGDFRIVQLTPPGSACSISLMRNEEKAGTLGGLHIVVPDIDQAREELVKGGVDVTGPYHFGGPGGAQVDGHDPKRGDFGTYLDFQDPDGNSWLIQEVPSRA